jgi:hypothetical protein
MVGLAVIARPEKAFGDAACARVFILPSIVSTYPVVGMTSARRFVDFVVTSPT